MCDTAASPAPVIVNSDVERAAFAQAARDGDLALHPRDEVADDREAQAGAALRARAAFVDAVEALEDPIEVFARDARAVVRDFDHDARIVRAHGERNAAALRGVLDRVL